jgi:hypothetical protein
MPSEQHSAVLCMPFKFDNPDGLPAVPVLPQTLLLLDLEAQKRCVDLRTMTELVLGDMGATVQIFRLARFEYGDAKARPNRIEGCIADLGVDCCMDAMSTQSGAGHGYSSAIADTWAHSREIAQYSRLIAEEMPDVNPDEAYLVGLMHTIGLLPSILRWSGGESHAFNPALTGYTMADAWSLPRSVVEFFTELQFGGRPTCWTEIVQGAHQRAFRSSINCPFEMGIRPLLYKDVRGC